MSVDGVKNLTIKNLDGNSMGASAPCDQKKTCMSYAHLKKLHEASYHRCGWMRFQVARATSIILLCYCRTHAHGPSNKTGWPSQESENMKIAERSKCVYHTSNQLCNLENSYPSHSVQICRSNKTIISWQRTSSCQTLHCPSSYPMMDSPRLAAKRCKLIKTLDQQYEISLNASKTNPKPPY
jgi:hypothetical protein